MPLSRLQIAALSLALVAPGALAAPPGADIDMREASRFKCAGGEEMSIAFTSDAAGSVAVVALEGGRHALPIQPLEPGPVRITWSDGARTLVWSAGVQLMWMEGHERHLSCGRGGHSH
jgi:hypothetical protein